MIASILLGTHPPVLPARLLVAAAEMFGVSESAARTALSRMASSGEVEAENGWYRLVSGPLLHRQLRQDSGREARREQWDGTWLMVIIGGGARSAKERAQRRKDLAQARLGELRDGVWVRPDNLGPHAIESLTDNADLVVGHYQPSDPLSVDGLWDLRGWAAQAVELVRHMEPLAPGLEAGDASLLADGFVVSAAVLRLFQRDPLLPDELLPAAWPGPTLRTVYDRFDTAYRTLLRAWFQSQKE